VTHGPLARVGQPYEISGRHENLTPAPLRVGGFSVFFHPSSGCRANGDCYFFATSNAGGPRCVGGQSHMTMNDYGEPAPCACGAKLNTSGLNMGV